MCIRDSLVVVCGDTANSHEKALASSIFPAVQNLLLAAGALGLGSALTTLPVMDSSGISRLLELPDHVVPMALVPIGWPSRTLEMCIRDRSLSCGPKQTPSDTTCRVGRCSQAPPPTGRWLP